MTRASLAPELAEDLPGERPLHLLVRDYPELLAVLRREGVDPAEAGGRSVAEVVEERPGLLRAMVDATAWRGAGDVGR